MYKKSTKNRFVTFVTSVSSEACGTLTFESVVSQVGARASIEARSTITRVRSYWIQKETKSNLANFFLLILA